MVEKFLVISFSFLQKKKYETEMCTREEVSILF